MNDVLKMIGWFALGYYVGRNGFTLPASLAPATVPTNGTTQQDVAEEMAEYVEVNGPAQWTYSQAKRDYTIG